MKPPSRPNPDYGAKHRALKKTALLPARDNRKAASRELWGMPPQRRREESSSSISTGFTSMLPMLSVLKSRGERKEKEIEREREARRERRVK